MSRSQTANSDHPSAALAPERHGISAQPTNQVGSAALEISRLLCGCWQIQRQSLLAPCTPWHSFDLGSCSSGLTAHHRPSGRPRRPTFFEPRLAGHALLFLAQSAVSWTFLHARQRVSQAWGSPIPARRCPARLVRLRCLCSSLASASRYPYSQPQLQQSALGYRWCHGLSRAQWPRSPAAPCSLLTGHLAHSTGARAKSKQGGRRSEKKSHPIHRLGRRPHVAPMPPHGSDGPLIPTWDSHHVQVAEILLTLLLSPVPSASVHLQQGQHRAPLPLLPVLSARLSLATMHHPASR